MFDKIGLKFDRLLVLEYIRENNRTYYKCKCDCGNYKTIEDSDLQKRTTKSCGCFRKERMTTHNLRYKKEYIVWARMIQRCNNSKTKDYVNYGGRGIEVCQEWYIFENFYRDMGPRPTSQHTLERKNNDGNYEKLNCKWDTRKVQNNNKRNSIKNSI